MIIFGVIIVYKRYRLINGSTNIIILQVAQALCASSGVTLFFVSYRFIPLPDLNTIRHTQVAWTALIAMIIFRERISISAILAIILSMIGIVCVAQPTFLFPVRRQSLNTTLKVVFYNKTTSNDLGLEIRGDYRLLGIFLALGSSLLVSFGYVLNKKLLELKIKQSILLIQFSSFTLVLVTLNHLWNRFYLHAYDHRVMFTWRFVIASFISLFQVLSSSLTQKAIKREHPSIITIVQSSDILFAILLQNIFATAKSDWLILLGATLVAVSILIVGINKLWQDRKKLQT
ncbi:unnamed protein product [Rotaria sp. Silwood2]|nr:unnamed protein product [Rotaria sp. Silwood2]CAF3241967.1 unnamed protein product [Rotaria sp. Silwood2]CAF3529014.1 unnamed protein product [Rotaria sp. Silwood2]CAF4609644.1 unnamed protein product [Rotaria sp. Silwood2]CAF4618213.1 unnamed protein product [Rotaria sp. Silwood2]